MLADKTISAHVRRQYETIYEAGAARGVNIPRGRELAADLGYDASLINAVPDEYWDSFHPCGNPLAVFSPMKGSRGLNLGCGVGIDSMMLADRMDGHLEIFNVDVVTAVLKKARRLEQDLNQAPGARPAKQWWIAADGRHLPFPGSVFDWVLMNGVFNIFPDKPALLAELARTLAPGGFLIAADLFAAQPLPGYFAEEYDAWGWCMSGALTVAELNRVLRASGFQHVAVRVEEPGAPLGRMLFSASAP